MYLVIESRDSYGEKNSEKVKCERESSSKGVKYSYKNEHGECKMFVLDDRVQIIRSGAINSTQVFREGKLTTFQYRTPYTASEFTLDTKVIKRAEDGFELTYEIYEGQEKINGITISVRETVE